MFLTTKQLIRELQKHPPEANIHVWNSERFEPFYVGGVQNIQGDLVILTPAQAAYFRQLQGECILPRRY